MASYQAYISLTRESLKVSICRVGRTVSYWTGGLQHTAEAPGTYIFYSVLNALPHPLCNDSGRNPGTSVTAGSAWEQNRPFAFHHWGCLLATRQVETPGRDPKP